MSTKSFWHGTAPEAHFPTLSGEIETDVVIVGGGIAGITAAQILSARGRNVVVLESMRVGLGTTGHSTGNLHVVPDESLHRIREKWGDEVLRAVVDSRREMIDHIERSVREYRIDCGFARRPHYIFATDDSQMEQIGRELDACVAVGLPATRSDELPLPFGLRPSLRIDDQAQFHPLSYVRGLAKAIESDHCRIFENSKVTEIDEKGPFVATAAGKVRAKKIILATHTPKGFHLVQAGLGPYREYGLAMRLQEGSYPEGIFWTLESPAHSVRSFEAGGSKYLIVIGEHHKTGQHDNQNDYFARVEHWTRQRFEVASVDYRWSAQHYKPADLLPFIGVSGTSDDLYIATGFSTSGLLYGPVAASILAGEISGEKSRWRDVFRANRFTPMKSAKDFLKENVNVAKQFVRDYLLHGEVEKIVSAAAGTGRIIEMDGDQLAVYRKADGELTVMSPACPHLGCVVHWNRFESSWDCPCHGSRFSGEGEVLEGPAIAPLKRRDVTQ